MADFAPSEVTIRSRRQLTLPAEICEELGLSIGDRLEVTVEGDAIVAKPRKGKSSKALAEIRRIFAQYGPPLDELQLEAERIRKDIYKERYGKSA